MTRPHQRLVCFGLLALAIANTGHWWLQHGHLVSEDLGDGLYGLGMGVAFGLLILAMIKARKEGAAR